jgi:tripartite-type tricarboxylate transporter receptor subunit TctC
MNLSLTRRKLLGAALLAGGLPAVVRAQEFPSKMITMIVPYPAGGPADQIARQMLPTLRRSLGQTIIVDNISGAGGAVGIQKLLAAPADGHYLVIGTPSDVILGPLTLTAVKHKPEQLRLLGLVSRAPLVLVSGAQGPARKLDDLLSAARNGGKEYTYGSIGIGSLYHLVAEDFAARQKLRMTHVPYKGVAPLLQDLIAGHVDLAFLPSAGNLVDMIGQGKLRAYAVTDSRRLARLPDVPTITEAAGLKDFDYEIWGGPFVARGVPDNVAQRLNKAVNETLQDAEFRRQIEAGGSVVGKPMSLTEAEHFLVDQTARYRRLAQQVKVDPQ